MISKRQLRRLAEDLSNIGVIKRKDPVVNSGVQTPIDIDFSKLISHVKLLDQMSTMLWLLTDPHEKYDRVCGMPYSALSRCGIPYVAISYAYYISKQTAIPMLMRRSVGNNNNNNVIYGKFDVGDKVAIVNDDMTNILEVVCDLMKEELNIGEVVVVLDREQGERELLEIAGIRVKSLFKMSELIDYLTEPEKKQPVNFGKSIVEVPQPIRYNIRGRRRGFPFDNIHFLHYLQNFHAKAL